VVEACKPGGSRWDATLSSGWLIGSDLIICTILGADSERLEAEGMFVVIAHGAWGCWGCDADID